METCFKCGITENKSLLYDAITSEGIQKICRKCSHSEEIPMIKNKDAFELKEFERKQDIYERISKISGNNARKKLNPNNLVLESQEKSLRDLVEKNVCKGLNKNAKPREDLIKNFHWHIKRYRRLKHLTTKQFADTIREPEKVVILAEQGIVPEGHIFIRKIEKILGIALIKPEIYEEVKEKEKTQLTFDKISDSDLTLADLSEIKEREKNRKRGFFGFFSSKKEKVPEILEDSSEFEDLDEQELEKTFSNSNFSQKKS